MRNNVDELVKRWGLRRKSELSDSHIEAVGGALRAIENRRLSPSRPPVSPNWWARLAPAAAAVVCIALFGLLFQGPIPAPGAMVCEVPCKAQVQVEVPGEPLVPVDRYQSLFGENL